MALLPPLCCWRPGAAPTKSISMAAAVRAPAMTSCACMGALERKETGVYIFLRCSSKRRNGAGGSDDSRRRAERFVVMARRGGGGADASRAQRSSTSRGPSKQEEASRNSRHPVKKMTTSKKTKQEEDEQEEENGLGEDALEALFAQLEIDLEAGGLSDNEDITEEDVIELENELAAALMEIEGKAENPITTDILEGDAKQDEGIFDKQDGDSMSLLDSDGTLHKQRISGETKLGGPKARAKVEEEYDDLILEDYEDEEEEEEQRIVNLETWQLKKLAAAVELGRRKVNIKALSAEVGLDRFDVLAWLKDPPPELLMYSATMEPEEDVEELPVDHAKSSSSPTNSTSIEKQDVESSTDGRRNWQSQKRLRKEHVATFERVFRKTDRPSNAMVQNMVELTHVPRKRIVEWFEQQRKAVRSSPKLDELR